MSTTFFDFLRDGLSFDGAAARVQRLSGLVKLAWQVRRERGQLVALTPEQLADIGIHPTVAKREAARELFDLPSERVKRVV